MKPRRNATEQDVRHLREPSCPLWLTGLFCLLANSHACFLLARNGCPAKSLARVKQPQTRTDAPTPARSRRFRQRPAPAHRFQTRLPVHPRSHRLWPALHGQRESQETRTLHRRPSQRRPSRRRRLYRRHRGRKISSPQHHREISRHKRRHHRHPRPLRHRLSTAQFRIRRRQRRRLFYRHPARIRQPVARRRPGKSAMATASGSSGPTAKKRSRLGPTPTVSTARAISRKNGRKTARSRRSKRSWSWT